VADPSTKDGRKEALAPVPATAVEGLLARTEPAIREDIAAGPTLAELKALAVACAKFWEGARAIVLPATARAGLVRTPEAEARRPETEGANVALVPAPETELATLLALAEPADCPVAPAGLLRADPCALVEACAMDCEETPDIDRPATARAIPL